MCGEPPSFLPPGDNDDDNDDDNTPWEEETVAIPIDGVLDLHTFSPKDIRSLVPDYIEACREKGIFEVRIIHGKGKGVQRRMVHSILQKLDGIAAFRLADSASGGWGATQVTLVPPNNH